MRPHTVPGHPSGQRCALSTDMAARACRICGCQEYTTGAGANDTRPCCMVVRGLPCQFDAPGPSAHPQWDHTPAGVTATGAATSWQTQHPLTPGDIVTGSGAPTGHTAGQAGGRRTASYSYNGVDWFEVDRADDPFASDSDSDEYIAFDASVTTRTASPGSSSAFGAPAQDRARGAPSTPYATAVTPTRPGATIPMEVIAVPEEGQVDLLLRHCVDCGLRTGSFCDGCLAVTRFPDEEWVRNQHTPLCTACDRRHGMCHFCRGLIWSVPPPHGV